MSDPHEVFRHLPWPFEDDRFPHELGAVVARTVLSGALPARQVVHTTDNDWLVADGVNDWNEPGAAIVGGMIHIVERNSSVAELATLPPGYMAERGGAGQPWVVTEFQYDE